MKPPTTLTATAACPQCRQPVRIEVPVTFDTSGPTVVITYDVDHVRQAVRVHALQHQGVE